MLTTSNQAKSPWGYTFGLVLAFLATFGGWYDPASFNRVNAWHFGIWQSCDLPIPSFKLFSFGVLVTVVVLLAWRSRRLGDVRGMFAMTAILLFIAAAFYVQVAFTRSSWLDAAIKGAADFENAVFVADSLNSPLSYDSVPDPGTSIPARDLVETLFSESGRTSAVPEDDLVGRFFAARPTMTYGWILYLAGSALAFFSAWRMLPNDAPARRLSRNLLLIFSLILVFQVLSPFIAESYVIRGDRAAATDRPQDAEHDYRRAIAWDEWYGLQPTLFLRIGQLRESHGDKDSPTARLYLAEENSANGAYPVAMDLLEKTDISQDPAMAAVWHDEISELSLFQGQTDYSAGEIGSARHEWLRSAQAKPDQVAVYYLLGQADTYLANYPEARWWYAQGQSRSGVTVTRALCLTGTGDTYYLKGQAGIARSYYLASLQAFFDDNYRTAKSLVDDYFR